MFFFIFQIKINLDGRKPPDSQKVQRGFYKEGDRYAMHAIYENFPEFEVKTKIDNQDASIFYKAKRPFSKPIDGYTAPTQAGKADLWVCLENDKTCLPIGYHSADITNIQATVQHLDPTYKDARHHTLSYTLKGFGVYSANITLVEYWGPGTYPNNNLISVKSSDTSIDLKFNITSLNVNNIFQLSYPMLKPQQEINYTEEDLAFYELSSNNTYIEYSLLETSPVLGFERAIQGYQIEYHPTWFMNLKTPIGCPAGYDCSPSNQTQANMWLCYDTIDLEYFCFPVIDLRYGFSLTASKLTFNTSFTPNVKVEMKLECDPTIPGFDDIKKSTFITASAQTNPRTYTFDIKTNLTCPREYIIPPIEKHFTAGAVIVVIVWFFILLFVCFGIVINYFIDGSLALPFASIWSDIGYYIIDGWNLITCASTGTSVKDAKYEQEQFEPTTKYASI